MKRTQISEIGKYAFVERLSSPFEITLDDAAVIDRGADSELVTTGTMLEGVDFDLQYTPLEHLGFKAIVAGVSNICAMNGRAEYATVCLGLSARFSVEDCDALYDGIRRASKEYNVKIVGGNTSASLTGLTIAVTVIGRVNTDQIVRRSGAQLTDLVCVTGNLGAAYMGMQLLEREKRAVGNNGLNAGGGLNAVGGNPEPAFKGHEYILQRQLKPAARRDVVESMSELGIRPTAMIDITRGLASAALHICESSRCGVRIYLDRLPIASETFAMAEELGADPVVAALNGGDDFELLFTAPLSLHKELLAMSGVDVIGHIVPLTKGAALTTPDGSEIGLQSPDFTARV